MLFFCFRKFYTVFAIELCVLLSRNIAIHTFVHKEYSYGAYYPTVRVSMHCGRWTNKSSVPGCRRPGGRSFQTRGPAAGKLLSPNLLWVCGTTNVRMSLELDRSGRRPASDSGRQSSMRHTGATPSSDWWTSPATLSTTRWRTGNQCSRRSTGVMWSRRQAPVTRRAAAFCTDCMAVAL